METDSEQLREPLVIGPMDAAVDRGAGAGKISHAIVAIHSKHYGRGPTRAKTVWAEDVVVTVLEDIYMAAERTLISVGRFEEVRNMRRAFFDQLEPAFVAAVEETVGRRVIAFLGQVSEDPPLATVTFVLQPRGRNGVDGSGDGT